jgi:putative aminopeptidase FrvX
MSSGFFGPMIKLVIIIAVAVTVINDAGRIIWGHYMIEDEARRTAMEARRVYQTSKSPSLATDAARLRAERNGGRLTGFRITPISIQAAVEVTPTTWVAHMIPAIDQYLSAKARHDLSL